MSGGQLQLYHWWSQGQGQWGVFLLPLRHLAVVAPAIVLHLLLPPQLPHQ